MADQPQDKLPTSKIARAGKFLQTGFKVGGNYMGYYGKRALGQKVTRAELDTANAEDILEGFTELRGTALKVAQMMSMDSVNLSEDMTAVLQKAQYSVPPMSAPLAIRTFTKSVGRSPEAVFDRFDPVAVKAASMGQVHQAWKDGQKLAVKIQYPGVADSVRSDIRLIRQLAPQFVKTPARELAPYFEEVEARLLEETDYALELQTSLEFKELCASQPGIVFPDYYPELSADRVLTMSWLEGQHLTTFLETADRPTINQAAQHIWNLYDLAVHKLRRVNADPHPGNFLFFPDGRVGAIDFGCTKRITPQMYDDYFALADTSLYSSPATLEQALRRLEILRLDDSPQKTELNTQIFGQLIRLLSSPMHCDHFDFGDPTYFQQASDLGRQITKTREARGSKDFLYVNRAFLGLFLLMHRMRANIATRSHYYQYSATATAA